MPATPTSLLIIRAWVEEGSADPLRADIRYRMDVSAGVDRTVTLTRPEAVSALVEAWLRDVCGDGTPD
jgi:hypothetical protein